MNKYNYLYFLIIITIIFYIKKYYINSNKSEKIYLTKLNKLIDLKLNNNDKKLFGSCRRVGFECIDFMIKDDFTVILIEINDEVGNPSFPIGNYKNKENNNLWHLYIKKYVNWIYNNGIEPIYNKKI